MSAAHALAGSIPPDAPLPRLEIVAWKPQSPSPRIACRGIVSIRLLDLGLILHGLSFGLHRGVPVAGLPAKFNDGGWAKIGAFDSPAQWARFSEAVWSALQRSYPDIQNEGT